VAVRRARARPSAGAQLVVVPGRLPGPRLRRRARAGGQTPGVLRVAVLPADLRRTRAGDRPPALPRRPAARCHARPRVLLAAGVYGSPCRYAWPLSPAPVAGGSSQRRAHAPDEPPQMKVPLPSRAPACGRFIDSEPLE